jgi:hypothetical protein
LSAHRPPTPSLPLSRSLHSTPLLPTVSALFPSMALPQPFSFQSPARRGGLPHSFYRHGGVPPSRSALLARSHTLFVRSFTKECSGTPLHATRSTLFFKTAGCIAISNQILKQELEALPILELLARLPSAKCVSCTPNGSAGHPSFCRPDDLSGLRGHRPRLYPLPLGPAILKGRLTRN